MNDRELLENAARATYYRHYDADPGELMVYRLAERAWSPLKNEGDAFRLMVALGISTEVYRELSVVEACTEVECFYEKIGEGVSADAAKRRAIVRAAAAMGEQL